MGSAFEYSLITVTRTEKLHHEFIVENYSIQRQVEVDESIDSDQFMAGGYLWGISFYPHGQSFDANTQGRTSLFISLKTDTNHLVPCLFELYLLDQSGKGNHHGRSTFNRFPPDITYASSPRLEGLLYFIKQEALEHSDYLKEDRLIISCTIQILNSHIEKLPNRSNKADLLVKVGGETFAVKGSILAAKSNVFRSYLLEGRQPHREIVISDMEPQIFKALMWFIYTGTLLEEERETSPVSSPYIIKSFVGKMLAAADRFKLNRLKSLYQSYILKKISVDSVLYYLHLAEICHASELKDACLTFASANRSDVLESEGLNYLKKMDTTLYLELTGLPSTD